MYQVMTEKVYLLHYFLCMIMAFRKYLLNNLDLDRLSNFAGPVMTNLYLEIDKKFLPEN